MVEEDQKMEGLRKEFNFMIENLKDKFSEKNLAFDEVWEWYKIKFSISLTHGSSQFYNLIE